MQNRGIKNIMEVPVGYADNLDTTDFSEMEDGVHDDSEHQGTITASVSSDREEHLIHSSRNLAELFASLLCIGPYFLEAASGSSTIVGSEQETPTEGHTYSGHVPSARQFKDRRIH
jgi:hypothetical protein